MKHVATYTLKIRGPVPEDFSVLEQALAAASPEMSTLIEAAVEEKLDAIDSLEDGDEVEVVFESYAVTADEDEDDEGPSDEEIEHCASCDEVGCEGRVAPYRGAADPIEDED